jgi:Reverse transcriptase (RNA-dependent DNA polymerase)
MIRAHPQIQFHITCPYTLEQIDIVERKHRQIVELGLATMLHSSIPTHYWPKIFESVTFVLNNLPSSSISFSAPYTVLFQRKPNYVFFKVIGCKCFPYTRPYADHKLAPRSKPCVFLGNSLVHKGYRCLDLTTNKVYLSRHVIFHETSFPFTNSSSSSSPLLVTSSTVFSPLVVLNYPLVSTELPISQHTKHTPSFSNVPLPITRDYERRCATKPSSFPGAVSPASTPTHSMLTRSKTKSQQHIPKALLTSTSSLADIDQDPTTYNQTAKFSHWREAMAHEIDALATNNTWSLVPASEASNIVGCKWVYKTKRLSDGTIERFKARLIAKGYTQEEGLDFTDTFSPVIKPTTIRLILSLAVTQKWDIRQLDVNNVFLHSELHELIYMSQPPGFTDTRYLDHVCHLYKALYGLQQSPRAWYHKLKETLLHIGFKSSTSYPSLFLFKQSHDTVFLLVYVDDIILTGNNSTLIQSVVQLLDQKFTIKDLDRLHFFLSIEVHHTDHDLQLTQSKYINTVLEKAKMQNAKSNTTLI